MKVFFGSDHRGFKLKEVLMPFAEELGYEVEDLGPFEYNESDDYPDFIKPVAEKVSREGVGVVLGHSGQGEAMVANRFKGVRAAVFYGGSLDIIRLSREHNNANVLSLGAGFLSQEEAKEALKTWLLTKFEGEKRHIRRIEKIDQ